MVSRRSPHGRSGASKVGCLVTLVLFFGTLYYGTGVGRIYWRYYALIDVMQTEARFASTRSDQAIQRNILDEIDEIGVPAEAKRLVIRRVGPPYRIMIRTEYREFLNLPFQQSRYLIFRPMVESRF